MKKILTSKNMLFLICVLFNQILNAQVKTTIYKNEIPANKILIKSPVVSEIILKAPTELDYLLKQQKLNQLDNNIEYDNKFAVPKVVEIDFLKEAKVIEVDNSIYYLLNIIAENALNISLQFKEFHLSKNCILSIHNENELTDSITSKENNENNLWATKVYRRATLNLILRTPISEKSLSNFKISKVSFGYKKFGGEYFGTPGASASCNINVQCPQGNTWQNERNSVAIMLVADGRGTCTGSLVNNTCNVNIPYVLTANHCLNGNLNNWVFQFQYFSTTCTPNKGGREDIQFNGCSLKANSANSDFALVQMNKTPSPLSGLAYAGWNRSTTPATNTVEIHHPASDLMKISLDANPAIAISWPGIPGLTHWRVRFQQGTVQPGSSGSPLFDQNHRIIGQCHGDQNNG